jgi:hypothetical protein
MEAQANTCHMLLYKIDPSFVWVAARYHLGVGAGIGFLLIQSIESIENGPKHVAAS